MTNTITCGSALEVLKTLDKNSIDTLITDPPYGLSFMGKKWDYDVPSIEIWQECLRVLKPGGTALIFAGSRTQHRMACNVEDAGFILKDCIMWLYGSGFPKATDLSLQFDKKACQDQLSEQLGRKPTKKEFDEAWKSFREVVSDNPNCRPNCEGKQTRSMAAPITVQPITAPTTPEAQLWNGWKSHGLKPAYEPILVAMKPNDGTYAQNALKWGVSGLNIKGGMIGVSENDPNHRPNPSLSNQGRNSMFGSGGHSGDTLNPQGRFPANVILDEEAGAMLDEQSGNLTSGAMKKPYKYTNTGFSLGQPAGETKQIHDSNSGGASRFFYCAKASKSERNAGCEGLEKRGVREAEGNKDNWDLSEGKVRARMVTKPQSNFHPTVKPLALMEYLCKLTMTPTGGIVLDCFVGSGSTCVACVNTGRDYIGIEREPEYVEIAKRRIAAAKEQKRGQMPLFKGD